MSRLPGDSLGRSQHDHRTTGVARRADADKARSIPDSWSQHSGALAAWADKRLVNRRDAYGRYFAIDQRPDPERTAFTDKSGLTLATLQGHFKGRSTGDLIGLHSTVRDVATGEGEVPACWSHWLAVDIDRHDDSVDAAATERAAKLLAERAVAMGFVVLLLDSNGRGGFHLLIVFSGPTPTAKVYALGKWLVRDWSKLGLPSEPEVFPKQAAIAEGGFGNWLRLPGRHHTHDHYTRVWEATSATWLEGVAAIKSIVRVEGNSPDLIPAKALAPPKPKRRSRGEYKPEDVDKDAARAREALGYLDPSMPYDDWLKVGMALTQLGREGLDLWDAWSFDSKDKYQEGLCDRKWRSFHGAGVKLGTLFHLAKAKGFEFPRPDFPTPPATPPAPPATLDVVAQDEDESHQDSLPHVICGHEDPSEGLKSWTPQAVEAIRLANAKGVAVFQRNRKLARLSMPVDAEDQPVIESLGLDALRGILDRAAHWGTIHQGRKGQTIKYGTPRIEIVRDLLSLGSLDPDVFPPLEAIAESPVFGADGSLILEPGYHRAAKLFYAPAAELKGIDVPRKPTAGDIASALDLIFGELLCDFPFKNQASKANALGVMLLPFIRLMISGPTPNHHFTSSTEGVGKGKCAAACAFPFIGRDLEINVQKESEAEWRKAITSFLLSGASHYFIDNMYNPLGWDDAPLDIDSGTLAAAWTGGKWKDRILGGQDEARVKLHAVFMSSGNNVAFSRELTRRLVSIELVPHSEDPSLRSGFKHDPLMDWARENRTGLTRACLVICRNWIARGCKPGGARFGSYESYAQTMSGILEAAGIRGFLDNRPKPGARKDRESIRWPALVEAWHERRGEGGITTGQLYELVFGSPDRYPEDGEPGIPDLQPMFADVVGEGRDLSRRQKFANAIGKQEGRVWGNWRIVATGNRARNGSPFYKLAAPDEPVDSDEVDDEIWEEGRE